MRREVRADTRPEIVVSVATSGDLLQWHVPDKSVREEIIARDLAESKPISYSEWRRRSLLERGQEWLGWLLERQQ
jgi:hypothetical protein